MKRYFDMILLALCLAGWLGVTPALRAQNTAAADAARQEAEDRYKRLTAEIMNLKESQALLQQHINALEKSLRDLADQVNRANNSAVTQERINRLAEQIQKVDEARLADGRRVADTIEGLQNAIKHAVAAPRSRPPPTRTSPGSQPPSGEYFEYVVQKGDTLTVIVRLYNDQNIKVSLKEVQDANPNVDWNRLQIGQKILVPKPKS